MNSSPEQFALIHILHLQVNLLQDAATSIPVPIAVSHLPVSQSEAPSSGAQAWLLLVESCLKTSSRILQVIIKN